MPLTTLVFRRNQITMVCVRYRTDCTDLALSPEELDPASFGVEATGPWVYVLSTALLDRIADIAKNEPGTVVKAWAEGDKAAATGQGALCATLSQEIQTVAVQARHEQKPKDADPKHKNASKRLENSAAGSRNSMHALLFHNCAYAIYAKMLK